MMSEILLSLFGNAATNLVESFTRQAFGTNDDEWKKRTKVAIASAASNFFETYDDKYGAKSNSFLARKENWEIVANSLRYDTPKLKFDQINPNGFKSAPQADKQALQLFVKSVIQEFKNDPFLNLKLGIKESLEISKETKSKLLKAIDELAKTINSDRKNDKELEVEVFGGNLAPQNELKEGKLYTRVLADNCKMTYMRRDKEIFCEIILRDGSEMYYEINENAHISIKKLPFEMNLNVPDEYIIKKEITKNEKGEEKMVYYGKWGLRLEFTKITTDKFSGPSIFNGKIEISTRSLSDFPGII